FAHPTRDACLHVIDADGQPYDNGRLGTSRDRRREESMDTQSGPSAAPHLARRGFLKHAAAVGLAAGTPAFPVRAQEKKGSSSAESGQVALAETLARYATSLKYEDLPDDIIRTTKRTILDTVGCAFGGYTAGPSKIAIKLASDVTAKQSATILCSGIKTS